MKRKLVFSLLFLFLLLSLETSLAQRKDVKFGTVKFTEDKTLVFGVYEYDNEIVFLSDGDIINVERLQFQFYFEDLVNETDFVIVEQFSYVNNTKLDLENNTFALTFDRVDSAYVDVVLNPTKIEKTVIIKYKDIRFVFSHITKVENLPFEENLTLQELANRFFIFGWQTFFITILFMALGFFLDQRAKEFPIPTNYIPLISAVIFFVLGTLNSLVVVNDLLLNKIYYFMAVGIISFVGGIVINTEQFIEYIGFKRRINGLKEKRVIVTARLYQFVKNGKKSYGIALDGFWEAVRRLFGNHVEFKIIETHSIDVEGYVKGFELESEGLRGEERVYEWVTVSNHKLPTRLIQDYNRRIQYYEEKFSELEEENISLKSNKVLEVNRKVNLALENHYTKMGVNMWLTNAISSDTLEEVAKRNNMTVEELERVINDEVQEIENNGVKSRIRKRLRRFDK